MKESRIFKKNSIFLLESIPKQDIIAGNTEIDILSKLFRKFDFSIFSRAKAQVENIPAPVDTATAEKLMHSMSATIVSYYNSAVEAGSKGLDHIKWFLNK